MHAGIVLRKTGNGQWRRTNSDGMSTSPRQATTVWSMLRFPRSHAATGRRRR